MKRKIRAQFWETTRFKQFFLGAFLSFSLVATIPILANGNPGKCEVHGERLQKETLPISYGLILVTYDTDEYDRVVKKKFPHAESQILGGCVIDEKLPTSQDVYFCSKCRKAEKAWMEKSSKKMLERFMKTYKRQKQ